MLDIPSHIRGLIFDVDGTIADTMPLHYRAWNQAMSEYGQMALPEPLFYSFAGVPAVRIMQILNEQHGYRLPVREAADRKEAIFEDLIPQACPIEPVVQTIRRYGGKLPMAAATGGTRVVCTKTLASLKLLHYFDAIVTSEDVTHGKPSPDIFLEAARRIDIPPQFCCVFEDGEPGLQGARAAGMVVIDVRPMCSRRAG